MKATNWVSQIKYLDKNQISDTTTGFKQNYILNTEKLAKDNIKDLKIFEYPDKQRYIRIATWNIRYFTDINNNMSIEKIQSTIAMINPDILCLNEVTVGFNKYYNSEVSFAEKFPEYHVLSICNTIPSWFSTVYGNCILIKKILYDKTCQSIPAMQYGIVNTQNKCFFNQYTHTYNHPKPHNIELDGSTIAQFGSKETRCFIKISFIDFDIFCTHLEAYDKQTRLKQFDELMSYVTRKSIILGDLNVIDTEKYLNKSGPEWNVLKRVNSLSDDNNESEINILKKKYSLKDSFEMSRSNKNFHGYTTWTNTIVDYILFTEEWLNMMSEPNTTINSNIYVSDASDHYPLYVDIYNEYFEDIMRPQFQSFASTNKGTHKTFAEMGWDHGKKFYHVSPLAAFDWFDNGKITDRYSFNDPYLTGNYSAMYGSNGVYVGTMPYVAIGFLPALVDRTSQGALSGPLKDMGVLFEFSIKQSYDTNANDNDVYIPVYGETYYSQNDSNYNVILGQSNIGKLTKKNYDEVNKTHNIFELSKIYLVYKLDDNAQVKITQNNELQLLFEYALNWIKMLYSERRETDEYHYDLNKNGYETEINIDNFELHSRYGGTDILYPLWTQMSGGNNIYYYKYTKYKSKYINAKKLMY